MTQKTVRRSVAAALTVLLAALHIFGVLPWLEWILWVVLVGWLSIRAGSAIRRAIGMLLTLGLYCALLLSSPGLETVRAMSELTPGFQILATIGWIVATVALALVLADGARASLRKQRSKEAVSAAQVLFLADSAAALSRRRDGVRGKEAFPSLVPPLKDALRRLLRETVDGEEGGIILLPRLMLAGPFLAASLALPLSNGNGMVGFFDDSVAKFLKAVVGDSDFPTAASVVAVIAWFVFSGVAMFICFESELPIDWLDRRETNCEKRSDVSLWSVAAAGICAATLIVLLVAPHLAVPWNVPAPILLTGWLTVLIVGLAFVRGWVRSLTETLFGRAIAVPIVGLLLTSAIVLSALDLNDNHELTYRRDKEWIPAPFAAVAFHDWLDKRFSAESRPTAFVVAAEGGGARAAYMTALTLEALRRYCLPFAERHFATIGVSGGSVGAALSAASEADSTPRCLLPPKIDPDTIVPAQVAGSDLLGPVLRGLLLSDLPMRTLPTSMVRSEGRGPINTWQNSRWSWFADRAQFIEWALDDTWYHASGRKTRIGDKSFRDFTPQHGRNRPALILLTTDVLTGRRIAFSHLRFRTDVPHPVLSNLLAPAPCRSPAEEARAPSEIRASLLTYEDIAPARDTTLLAAAVASARFPIISPAATLPCPEPRWRVVDGGYFENSGLTTALELMDNMVRGATVARRDVRVVLIRIENGEATTGNSDRSSSALQETVPTANDLMAPVQAFLGTRNARADAPRRTVDLAARQGRYGAGCPVPDGNRLPPRTPNCVEFAQVIIKLQRCNVPIPLSWSLSAAARADIARQLGFIGDFPKELAWWNDLKCMTPISEHNRGELEKLTRMATER